jgi:hypothetical protein
VIRTDSDQLRRFRSASRSASHEFDLSFIDDVCCEGRQTRVFAYAKNCTRLQPAHVVLSDDALR